MGYTTDNPPRFVKPLLEEYGLEITECGYKGSWATIRLESGNIVQLRREVSNSVTFKKQASGNIRTSVSEKNVAKRDELVGEVLLEELGGYESLEAALEDHEGLRMFGG